MKALRALWRHLATQGMGQALRHSDYRLFIFSHFVSAIGYWIQRIGIGWLTWDMTHSGTWLGIMAAGDALPIFVLVPIAGAIADRVDRLKLFRTLQVVCAVLALILTVLVVTETVTVWSMAFLVLLNGLVNAMLMPLRLTMGPGLVPRQDMSAAIGMHSISFQLSAVLGPALAGVILDQMGVEWTFIGNTLCYIVFVGALYMIGSMREEQTRNPRTGVLADTWEGIRYAARHKSIGPLLLLILAFAIFSRPYLDMMPGLADEVFKRGAHGLATLVSAAGVGGMIAGIWIAQFGRIERMTPVVLTSVLVLALSLFVFSITSWFALAIACVVVIAAMSTISSTGAQMMIQTTVEGSMRGRVMSLYGLTWRGAPAVGALIIGALSSVFGLQMPLAAGAVLCLVAWIVIQPRRHALAAGFAMPRLERGERP